VQTTQIEFRGSLAWVATCPEGRTWAWLIEDEYDSEGFRTDSHVAVDVATGEERHLNWSRFQYYTSRHFVAFVEGGFANAGRSNIWPDDILPSIAA
jgi:hypothetical protein